MILHRYGGYSLWLPTITIAACLCSATLTCVTAATVYVSTDGSDTNAGTAAAPFASPQRARDAFRQLKKQGPITEPFEIILRAGEYFLSETLVLTPEDSGTHDCPVIWRAADGERVVLSGGRRIAGRWRTQDRKTWYVDVPGTATHAAKKRHAAEHTVDYASAKVRGSWTTSSYAGPTYLHDGNEDKGAKHVRFPIRVDAPGEYRVSLSNVPLGNRSSRVPVTVASADGEQTVVVNQKSDRVIDIGTFRFVPNTPGAVTISTEGAADGYVIADAVSFSPVEDSQDSDEVRPPDAWNFRQLFVDGRRAIRARYPNVDVANPFLYATGGSMGHVQLASGLVKESWNAEPDAQINIVPQWKFFNQWNDVVSVDVEKGVLHLGERERHATITPGNWFWIEGVRSELDQPGEWYLNRQSGRLFYMPESGGDPNGTTIIAPRLNRIVHLVGDVAQGTHVSHVVFKGLEFRHTTFTLGHIEPRVHTDAAVMFENASLCRIDGCHFESLGGYALWLHLDSHRNVFHRNTVQDTGGGGVLLTGARFAYMDESKIYTPGEAAEKVAPILNKITHNTVKHCGRIRYYGGGVHLDSRPFSMSMAPGNYIAHNHFQDLSRNGVFAFRNQGGNVVEYNEIHDAMQTTIDGACIHFGSMNHLNAPNFILNNWLYDIWGYEQRPNGRPVRHLANGVFLDWDTSNTTVRDNYVYNAGGEPIKVIWNNANVVNTGNHSSISRITPPFVKEVGPTGTASNGIVLEENGLTGQVIHYTTKGLVQTSGVWKPRRESGMWGLFEFSFLEAGPDQPAEITYSLPVPEDGRYEVSLLYLPNKKSNASNATVRVRDADGTHKTSWNMQSGNNHGFAVGIGEYRFRKGDAASVAISNEGANGLVVADSVAFVKVSD